MRGRYHYLADLLASKGHWNARSEKWVSRIIQLEKDWITVWIMYMITSAGYCAIHPVSPTISSAVKTG